MGSQFQRRLQHISTGSCSPALKSKVPLSTTLPGLHKKPVMRCQGDLYFLLLLLLLLVVVVVVVGVLVSPGGRIWQQSA